MNFNVSKAWLAKDLSLGAEISWWFVETFMASVITYAMIKFSDLTLRQISNHYGALIELSFPLIYLFSFITIDRTVTGSGTLRSLVKGLLSLGLVFFLLAQPGYDETSKDVPRG